MQFDYNEWTDVPKIISTQPVNTLKVRHGITAVDYILYQGEKALLIEDSWGVCILMSVKSLLMSSNLWSKTAICVFISPYNPLVFFSSLQVINAQIAKLEAEHNEIIQKKMSN